MNCELCLNCMQQSDGSVLMSELLRNPISKHQSWLDCPSLPRWQCTVYTLHTSDLSLNYINSSLTLPSPLVTWTLSLLCMHTWKTWAITEIVILLFGYCVFLLLSKHSQVEVFISKTTKCIIASLFIFIRGFSSRPFQLFQMAARPCFTLCNLSFYLLL